MNIIGRWLTNYLKCIALIIDCLQPVHEVHTDLILDPTCPELREEPIPTKTANKTNHLRSVCVPDFQRDIINTVR